MQKILDGVRRFQREVFPEQKHLFEALATGQEPLALFITCGDSRVVPSLLTQTQPGELFLSRQVGNIVPPHGSLYGGVSSTIEYAVGVLKVERVILCGHSGCGAMRAALHPETLDDFPNARRWLGFAEAARQVVNARCPDGSEDERLDLLIHENVRTQLRHLITHPVVAVALAKQTLQLHGWVYHFESGEVDVCDHAAGEFTRLRFE